MSQPLSDCNMPEEVQPLLPDPESIMALPELNSHHPNTKPDASLSDNGSSCTQSSEYHAVVLNDLVANTDALSVSAVYCWSQASPPYNPSSSEANKKGISQHSIDASQPACAGRDNSSSTPCKSSNNNTHHQASCPQSVNHGNAPLSLSPDRLIRQDPREEICSTDSNHIGVQHISLGRPSL